MISFPPCIIPTGRLPLLKYHVMFLIDGVGVPDTNAKRTGRLLAWEPWGMRRRGVAAIAVGLSAKMYKLVHCIV